MAETCVWTGDRQEKTLQGFHFESIINKAWFTLDYWESVLWVHKKMYLGFIKIAEG